MGSGHCQRSRCRGSKASSGSRQDGRAAESDAPSLNREPGFALNVMAEERIVGIDLGTTNSLVAYMEDDSPVIIPGEDGSNLVPSVVALTQDARGDHIVVGNRARTHLIE